MNNYSPNGNQSSRPTDDAGGQMFQMANQVAGKFLEAPDALSELGIRTGTAASLQDSVDWYDVLFLAYKYRNPQLAAKALAWFNSTRGADGEANRIAMSVAAQGQINDRLFRDAQTGGGVRGFLRRKLGGDAQTVGQEPVGV